MSFKILKAPFLCLFLICLAHCGLRWGEEAPAIPKYNLPVSNAYCSQLDYEEEFSSYFLERGGGSPGESGERLRSALRCIVSRMARTKDLINHRFFEKQELVNFLNQDFVRTEDMAPIIDHILDDSYFKDYALIKASAIRMIDRDFSLSFAEGEALCQKRGAGKIVFSKKEVGVFEDFLINLSEFFVETERRAYDVFEKFFKARGKSDSYLLSKSQLKNSTAFREGFIPFLSDYLKSDFPGYSRFIQQAQLRAGAPPRLGQRKRLKNEILQPLLAMAQLPPSSAGELSAQNVKYILLNIYIMKEFFALFDQDQNFSLSPEELEPLSCFISPLISVIIKPALKDKWEFVRDFYTPEAIAAYIINRQALPSGAWDMSFLRERLLNSSASLEPLSYPEVSRLISLLFLEFFQKLDLN